MHKYFKEWESKKNNILKEKIKDEIRIAEVLDKEKELAIKIRSMGKDRYVEK